MLPYPATRPGAAKSNAPDQISPVFIYPATSIRRPHLKKAQPTLSRDLPEPTGGFRRDSIVQISGKSVGGAGFLAAPTWETIGFITLFNNDLNNLWLNYFSMIALPRSPTRYSPLGFLAPRR